MDLTRRHDPAKSGEQDLIDARFPAFNFDVIHGVSYRIDPTEPSRFDPDGKLVSAGANRIRDLAWNGAPVPDDALFMVATNNYRASGGGNFPGNDGSTIAIDAPDLTRDVMMRYVSERGTVAPAATGSWRLAVPDDITATFLTGPAAPSGGELPGAKVARIGDGPDGFAKYRVTSA